MPHLHRLGGMAKDYEKIYSKPELYWGKKPSELTKRFAELAPEGVALDLGMGEGRDVLYLASEGFEVIGVESTQAGVNKCERQAHEQGLNIKTVVADAREFKIAKNKYAIIVAMNLFQFMHKKEAADICSRAIAGLKRKGLFIAQTFTIDDPSYKPHKRKSHEIAPGVFRDGSGVIYSLYNYGELLEMSQPLRPIYYAEYDYFHAHGGVGHWHGVADLVGKKI